MEVIQAYAPIKKGNGCSVANIATVLRSRGRRHVTQRHGRRQRHWGTLGDLGLVPSFLSQELRDLG